MTIYRYRAIATRGVGGVGGLRGWGGGGVSLSIRNKLGKNTTRSAKFHALAALAFSCAMQKGGFLVFGEHFSIVSGVV